MKSILTLLCLLLCGCVQLHSSVERSATTVSADELQGYLCNNFGIAPAFPHLPVFGDAAYEYASATWFFGEFAARINPVAPIRRGGWDCEDEASQARLIAQTAHRGRGPPAAVAVAEFWYYRNGNPMDEHAIILGVFGPNEIGFIEPQNRTRVRLRPGEKCTWYRF